MKKNTANRLKKYFSTIIAGDTNRLFIEPCENNNDYYLGFHDSYDNINLWSTVNHDVFRCMSFVIRDFNHETK